MTISTALAVFGAMFAPSPMADVAGQVQGSALEKLAALVRDLPKPATRPGALTREAKLKSASKLLGKTIYGITDLVELDVRKPHVAGKASLGFINFEVVQPEDNWAASGNNSEDCFVTVKFNAIKAGRPHLFSFHINNDYTTVSYRVITRTLKTHSNSNPQTHSAPKGPFVLSYVFTPSAAGEYKIFLSPTDTLKFHLFKVEISVVD